MSFLLVGIFATPATASLKLRTPQVESILQTCPDFNKPHCVLQALRFIMLLPQESIAIASECHKPTLRKGKEWYMEECRDIWVVFLTWQHIPQHVE
jgi:hypothetical protein